MHGETAAAAMYARRLVKEEKAGEDLQPTIDKMNALIQDYAKKSSPKFCAKAGMTDEIVDMNDIRPYIQAFRQRLLSEPREHLPGPSDAAAARHPRLRRPERAVKYHNNAFLGAARRQEPRSAREGKRRVQ